MRRQTWRSLLVVSVIATTALVGCSTASEGGSGDLDDDATPSRTFPAVVLEVTASPAGRWGVGIESPDGDWVVVQMEDATLGRCYAVRPIDGVRWTLESARTGPWPAVPDQPDYELSDEIASCVRESVLRTSVVEGLQYDISPGGVALLLGALPENTTLRSVSSTSQLRVLTAGSMFVVEAPNGDAVLDAFELILPDGSHYPCNSPDAVLGELLIDCDRPGPRSVPPPGLEPG
jgi:hypothetical protein